MFLVTAILPVSEFLIRSTIKSIPSVHDVSHRHSSERLISANLRLQRPSQRQTVAELNQHPSIVDPNRFHEPLRRNRHRHRRISSAIGVCRGSHLLACNEAFISHEKGLTTVTRFEGESRRSGAIRSRPRVARWKFLRAWQMHYGYCFTKHASAGCNFDPQPGRCFYAFASRFLEYAADCTQHERARGSE